MSDRKEWAVIRGSSSCNHVVPIDDIKEHVIAFGCWCKPYKDGDDVIVHNSMDEREKYEPDYRGNKRKPS